MSKKTAPAVKPQNPVPSLATLPPETPAPPPTVDEMPVDINGVPSPDGLTVAEREAKDSDGGTGEGEAVEAPPAVVHDELAAKGESDKVDLSSDEHAGLAMFLLAKFPTRSDHHQRFANEAARALAELGWKTQINPQGAALDANGMPTESCLWVWKEAVSA